MMSCNEIDNEIQYMIYGPPLIFLSFIFLFVSTIIQESGRTARKWESRELHSQGEHELDMVYVFVCCCFFVFFFGGGGVFSFETHLQAHSQNHSACVCSHIYSLYIYMSSVSCLCPVWAAINFFIIYFSVCVHNNTRKWKNSKEMGKQGAPFTGWTWVGHGVCICVLLFFCFFFWGGGGILIRNPSSGTQSKSLSLCLLSHL